MPASTLYLIRKNRQWVKYELIEGLTLTGAINSYSSVTGAEATNIITVAGSAIPTGTPFYFQSIAGGAGLTTGTIYWAVGSSGSTLQASLTPGGAAVNFTTDITAAVIIATADEMNVWSSEFRDIFNQTGAGWSGVANTIGGFGISGNAIAAVAGQGGVMVVPDQLTPTAYGVTGAQSSVAVAATTMRPQVSDEIMHVALRQTLLKRTHWKFDLGSAATPRYLYATWADGDIVANNPPETDA
jgi:hypothetical protein